MMLGQSRIAIAAAVIAVSAGLMPAHSQTSIEYPPPDHPIDFYRDLVSNGAKLAVKDDTAKIEVVQIWPPAAKGSLVAREIPPMPAGTLHRPPMAAGYDSIYYFESDRTVLLT
jgi:hypothetical protein